MASVAETQPEAARPETEMDSDGLPPLCVTDTMRPTGVLPAGFVDPRRGGGGPSHVRFDDVDADVDIEHPIRLALPALVEALPSIRITSVATCFICLEDFVVGEQVLQLPCPHFFHDRCIRSWFSRRDTCLICRVVLAESTSTPARASTSTSQ